MSDKMSIEELQFLKDNRRYLRTKATKRCNIVKTNIQHFSFDQCTNEIADLETLRTQLTKSNDEVSKGIWLHVKDRNELDAELADIDKYDEQIVQTQRLLTTRIKDVSVAQIPSAAPNQEFARISSQLKLPQLPLPQYSHSEGESLDSFFTNFENIISKYSLSPFEKFVFLERQLSKEPLTLIKSLQGSEQSYDSAKELLIKAFASPLTQKYDIIKRLAKLHWSQNDDPFVFISEMRIILQTFNKLNINTNDVLQYFVWSALPIKMQNQFIHITNTNKPSLNEIEEKMFEAVERYQSMNKHSNTEKSKPAQNTTATTNNFAANVHFREKHEINKFKKCVLCSIDGESSER